MGYSNFEGSPYESGLDLKLPYNRKCQKIQMLGTGTGAHRHTDTFYSCSVATTSVMYIFAAMWPQSRFLKM